MNDVPPHTHTSVKSDPMVLVVTIVSPHHWYIVVVRLSLLLSLFPAATVCETKAKANFTKSWRNHKNTTTK
eukprot:3547139-Amphidinium_carterae.4